MAGGGGCHGRLLAARKLGMTEVPVIVLANLTESQRRALVIADNQLALSAGWDEEILRLELAALQEEDFDLNLVGFDDEELARLLAEQDATFGCSRWQSALDSPPFQSPQCWLLPDGGDPDVKAATA